MVPFAGSHSCHKWDLPQLVIGLLPATSCDAASVTELPLPLENHTISLFFAISFYLLLNSTFCVKLHFIYVNFLNVIKSKSRLCQGLRTTICSIGTISSSRCVCTLLTLNKSVVFLVAWSTPYWQESRFGVVLNICSFQGDPSNTC